MVTMKKPRVTKVLTCDDLTDEQDELARHVLARSQSPWGMWTLHVLFDEAKPLRFSRIHERVEGVSQKVLTQTLRTLERDGMISREVFPEVPPRVEYQLTSLGRALLKRTLPVWDWIVTQVPKIEAARAEFDRRAGRN